MFFFVFLSGDSSHSSNFTCAFVKDALLSLLDQFVQRYRTVLQVQRCATEVSVAFPTTAVETKVEDLAWQ
jgi:hypothetical protein